MKDEVIIALVQVPQVNIGLRSKQRTKYKTTHIHIHIHVPPFPSPLYVIHHLLLVHLLIVLTFHSLQGEHFIAKAFSVTKLEIFFQKTSAMTFATNNRGFSEGFRKYVI